MLPKIDHSSHIPINEQIAQWMRKNILSNRWSQDLKLPSEDDLASSFKVSRGTIRKAIEILIDERLLMRIHGKGTFVDNHLVFEQQPAGRIAGFSRDLISRGIPFSTDVLLSKIIVPDTEVSDLLSLKPKQKIFHMKRLRIVRNNPVIFVENHIVHDFCEGIASIDFKTKQLYATLEDEFKLKLDWARRTYIAKIADKNIAQLLKIKFGAPVMYLEELYHLVGDTPVELTRAWINAEVFHISTLIKRDDEKRDTPGIYR